MEDNYAIKEEIVIKCVTGLFKMYCMVFNAGVDALECLKHDDVERAKALIMKSHMDAEDLFLNLTETIDIKEWAKLVEEFEAGRGGEGVKET